MFTGKPGEDGSGDINTLELSDMMRELPQLWGFADGFSANSCAGFGVLGLSSVFFVRDLRL